MPSPLAKTENLCYTHYKIQTLEEAVKRFSLYDTQAAIMKKIFMIGNTHFDPVWLWRWDEAMASIHSTFRSALDRMNEDPDFTYSFATPPVFEWIRNTDPALFAEIAQRVEEGRWELAEGWYVQPDCYSASGESYARQGLLGQRYLKKTFGRYSDTVFNIDSFGHPAVIPQLLQKSHVQYYCMCRPEKHHVPLSSPYFLWEGRDGSTVRAFRAGQFAEIYTKDLPAAIEAASADIAAADCDELMVYGVTNHGGAPTKQAIADIRRLQGESEFDLIFSGVRGYFEAQEKPALSFTGEFITGDYGVYTNNHEIKRRNRRTEYALLNAEKASVLAYKHYGRPYPREALNDCWKDLLFNQFHDILGGASIREAYTDAYHGLGRATLTAEEITQYALQNITHKIRTPGRNPDHPWNLVVWNLHTVPYKGYIEAEVQWLHEFPAYSGGILLEDADGNRFPCQIILERSVIEGFRSRFVFEAEIPAMGYRAFRVVKTEEASPRCSDDTSLSFDTGRFDVSIDGATGLLEKITDNVTKRVLSAPLKPACYADDGDTWCFNVEHHGALLEPFSLRSLRITERGIHRTTFRAEYTFRSSRVVLYYTFYQNKNYFDVRYSVNWMEPHTVLTLDFETGCTQRIVSAPFSAERRKDALADQPMGEWLTMQDDRGGVSFLADSLFSYTSEGSAVSLNVLRSCIFGDLRLSDLDPTADYPIMEQGLTDGRVRVVIHEGDFVRAEIPAHAAAFNEPPIVICEANHDGTEPAQQSFLSLAAAHTAISAIKLCEDDDSIIVRLCEYAGCEESVTLSLCGIRAELPMSPYEIKTVRLHDGHAEEVYITEDAIL